ncbi:MAG TPA: CBS domain-containing protein [Nitrososphaera sp.]
MLPALGYGDQQLEKLESSINNAIADCDAVVLGTPADLTRRMHIANPVVRVRFEGRDFGETGFSLYLDRIFAEIRAKMSVCNAQNGNAFVTINTFRATSVIGMALNPSIRVKAAMSRDIVSVESERSVRSAVKTMVKNDLGSVVITQEGEPAGIVTERDVMKALGYGKVNLDTEIGTIMSKPLIAIDSDATLGEAADMMIKRKIRRLLVKEGGKYVGIITQRDLQRLMTDTFKSLLLI